MLRDAMRHGRLLRAAAKPPGSATEPQGAPLAVAEEDEAEEIEREES